MQEIFLLHFYLLLLLCTTVYFSYVNQSVNNYMLGNVCVTADMTVFCKLIWDIMRCCLWKNLWNLCIN